MYGSVRGAAGNSGPYRDSLNGSLGKPKKLAQVAAMRKLLIIISALTKRDERWVDPTPA